MPYCNHPFTDSTLQERPLPQAMFIHHIMTILLISISWTTNFFRVGTLVLWVHDQGCNSTDILDGLNPSLNLSLNHRPIRRLPKHVLNLCLNPSLKF